MYQMNDSDISVYGNSWIQSKWGKDSASLILEEIVLST